ncbi:hypothetical protein UFOVP509_32 [uncultured Caudovirales phage]|uniref:Uncharacterized protein n=1 Tax=uncultured Caudovirales phage TaxID=2100421 RepID=A0A6J5MR08_9CAUD|nr:hypothetical protein UFOVP509_32 [uncultured Caudovirales phage]
MRALVSNCQDCKNAPTLRTRQRAFGARPAQEWLTCCEKHAPGAKLNIKPKGWPVCVGAYHETERLS